MQKFKELKYVQRVLVFLLAFCIVFAGSSTDAMAKSKQAPAVKSISLKIGKKKVILKNDIFYQNLLYKLSDKC